MGSTMKLFLNLLVFTLLMTYAIRLGSLFGMALCGAGFLIMMGFIDELEEK
jgi:hypothetical protein